ncbi:MAG: DUF4388 domain-containing protein [Candidatus Obscuribacterales bacterium]|nr:DUF4388 domain-containing protein [Candidatus Obscuribacterales bacterium]
MLSPDPGSRNPNQRQDEEFLSSTLNFLTYSYRENLFAEFERLVREEKRFDGLIVDLMQTGFSLPLDIMIKFHSYARRLLKPQGVLLFIKADAAVTLTKDDPGGGLTFNIYDSPFGIFARYPLLADYVCATVTGIDRRRMRGGGNTLANHILFTSTPVLTERGTEIKSAFELHPPQNWLLQFIDDYSTIEGIARLMEGHHGIHPDESVRLMQELETDRIIYPVFTRIQFLASCYHNHKPFRLGRYMVAAGIITAAQLEELLELQQEEGWGRNQKTFLGLLAVRKGFINTRELEILLHDQYLYGGYHKADSTETSAASKKRSMETMKNSMIGSLGAIDCAGLLQSISTAKKTGTLNVEDRDKNIVIAFHDGKPTQAKMGKLKGPDAVVEFLVSWTEGIFVFRDGVPTLELDEACALKFPLDKMLLDAALFQDNANQIISMQPGERNVILERVWNFDDIWRVLSKQTLRYFDETPVSEKDKEHMPRIGSLIDGLTTLDEVIKSYDEWTTHMVLKTVQFFIDNKLVQVQQTSLFKPLSVFQKIAGELQQYLGPEDNRTMLEVSLHYVHGDSPAAQRFHIDKDGRVSVNLSQVKASGTPVSVALLELRRWMEAYLAYARRQLDPRTVDGAIARVVQGGS